MPRYTSAIYYVTAHGEVHEGKIDGTYMFSCRIEEDDDSQIYPVRKSDEWNREALIEINANYSWEYLAMAISRQKSATNPWNMQTAYLATKELGGKLFKKLEEMVKQYRTTDRIPLDK